MSSFVEEDVDVFGAILVPCEEGEEDNYFWDGVKGATTMAQLRTSMGFKGLANPVCPAAPRAAPVAVKKTMVSRRRLMLAS